MSRTITINPCCNSPSSSTTITSHDSGVKNPMVQSTAKLPTMKSKLRRKRDYVSGVTRNSAQGTIAKNKNQISLLFKKERT